MSQKSAIEWTDSTWNPTRGCSRVSPGCVNCYAEGVARRFSGAGGPYEGLIHSSGAWNGRIMLAEKHLLDPIRWVKPRRIFVDSMSDLFHDEVPFEYIDKVFAVMACTTRHTYQILTKRPQRMLEYFNRLRWRTDDDFEGFTYEEETRLSPNGLCGHPDQVKPSEVYDAWVPASKTRGGYDNCGPLWPLENVWLGVSCENQETADERVPLLMQIPASVRFLSCEPLLGSIDLKRIVLAANVPITDCADPRFDKVNFTVNALCGSKSLKWSPIDWVIAGGESGHGARGMDWDWPRKLRAQCAEAGVAFFMKQLSQQSRSRWFKDFEAFPEDLQVRQYPVVAA